MGVIDEREFNKELGRCLESIEENHKVITAKFNEAMKSGKLDFEDAEKLFVFRVVKKLEAEINIYAHKDIDYDSIKGSWYKQLYFYVQDWDEFKAYEKFIDDDAFHENLKACMRHSFKKYNVPVGVHAETNVTFKMEITYNLSKGSWYPGIGSAEFLTGEKAK